MLKVDPSPWIPETRHTREKIHLFCSQTPPYPTTLKMEETSKNILDSKAKAVLCHPAHFLNIRLLIYTEALLKDESLSNYDKIQMHVSEWKNLRDMFKTNGLTGRVNAQSPLPLGPHSPPSTALLCLDLDAHRARGFSELGVLQKTHIRDHPVQAPYPHPHPDHKMGW